MGIRGSKTWDDVQSWFTTAGTVTGGSYASTGAWTFGNTANSLTHTFNGSTACRLSVKRNTATASEGFFEAASGEINIGSLSNTLVHFYTNAIIKGEIATDGTWTFGPASFTGTHQVQGSLQLNDSNQTTITIINNQGGGGSFGTATGEGIYLARTPGLNNQAMQIDCFQGYAGFTARSDSSYGQYRFRGYNGTTFLDYLFINANATTPAGTFSATNCMLAVNKDSVTSRSINAAGTVNQNGADYAEYMTKNTPSDVIAAGELCGVDEDGLLTKKWSEAVSFVIKSTNPGLVGNDNWFTRQQGEEESDEDYAAAQEEARQAVDRIAFCGQVPCTMTGAYVSGNWVVPTEGAGDTIKAVAVADGDLTFAQYKMSPGKVWKDLGAGKALVAVGLK